MCVVSSHYTPIYFSNLRRSLVREPVPSKLLDPHSFDSLLELKVLLSIIA